MPDSRLTQPSFTAGELSPALYARKDLARYQVGARKLSNCFVHAHGGVSNRAGLRFAAEVKDHSKTNRLTTFEAANDEAFLMVWSDLNVRPMFQGAYLDAGGGTPYEITTPYGQADLADLYMEQSNDVATIVHPSYPIRELGRYDTLDWRMSTVGFASQVPAPEAITATVTEGYTGYDASHKKEYQTYKVAAVGSNGEEGLPSVAIKSDTDVVLGYEQNYITLEWTPAGVTEAGSDTPGASLSASGVTKVHLASASALIPANVVTHIGLFSTSPDPNAVVKILLRNGAGNFDIEVSEAFSHPGGGWAYHELAAPYTVPAGPNVRFTGAYTSVPVRQVSGNLHAEVAGNTTGLGQAIPESIGDTTATRVRYASTSSIQVDSYIVYKAQNGIYGYIGTTTDTTFRDTNFSPSFSQGPQSGSSPFVGDDNYPSVVTFVQQRRAFARTNSRPQTIWETQAGNYDNMGTASPIRDSDAIEFTLASRKKQDVYHIVPLDKGMIVFTRSGEWKVTGRDGDVITPSSVYPTPQSTYGISKHLKPLIAGEQMLFVKRAGQTVLEMGYSLEADRYVATDLTILAKHLFEGRQIVAWDYAASPDGVIWCVMDDGKGLCLTYLKEHDVWGWGRMETRGKLLDVSVVPETSRDVPYFLVQRRIGGASMQYIEYLADRSFTDVRDCFFVDSGLSLDNPVSISAISLGVNTTCTSVAHGLINGDTVELSGVSILDDDGDEILSLDGRWTVANKTNDTFRLAYEYDNIESDPPVSAGDIVDTSAVSSGYYSGDGVFRKGFLSVAGLDHLEGRTVVALCDGSVVDGITITAGSTGEIDGEKHFRIHAGLSYSAVVGTLDLFNSQADDTGITKGIGQAFIRLDRTRGLKIGRAEDDVQEELYTRDGEDYTDPAALQNGIYRVNEWTEWGDDQPVYIVQDYPLPMTILGVTLENEYGGSGS